MRLSKEQKEVVADRVGDVQVIAPTGPRGGAAAATAGRGHGCAPPVEGARLRQVVPMLFRLSLDSAMECAILWRGTTREQRRRRCLGVLIQPA